MSHHAERDPSGSPGRAALEIFVKVCDDAALQQDLHTLCRGDAALVAQVQRLLELDRRRGRFLAETLCAPPIVAGAPSALPDFRAGDVVDGYRIVRRLSEGAVGVVYVAEQLSPKRDVALKFIKAGIATSGALRRFEHEAEALAAIGSPGVAHVYEFRNRCAAGCPMLVMELIEGSAIDAYAREHRINLRARVELVAQVCEAVADAHYRGVIHRDLKPANVLVTRPEPRRRDEGATGSAVSRAARVTVVDFGVACITGRGGAAATTAGELLGSPAYMSPEQFAGRPGAVDVRTDVYALGVMLYQLLAGRLPFRSLREKAEETAAPMPAGCPRELRCIVAKAMSPEQSARYGSASALADDLRRFLRGERVLAHPPTLAYLMRAYARRQRGLAAGLVAAMVVAVAGTAAVWISAVSEARARREADRERSVSESVVDHLVAGVIGAASPYARMGLDISVARALDHAAAHVEGRFSDPLVEASVRMAIGESYADLGRAVEAEAQLRRAADLRRSALGERDPRTIEATRRLASAIVAQPDRTAEARALYDRLYATARDALGPSDERTLHVGAGLAAALDYGGDSGAAATLLRELLDRAVAAHGEAHEVAQVIANDLATALAQTGALEEAERLLERTLEHGRRTLGDDHPDVILTQNNLAAVYGDAGRFDDAAALHRRTLESCRRIFGRDHPHTATSAGNLGAMLTQLRDFAAAEPLCREALEFWRGEAGPRARSTLIATLNLGQCLLELGRIEESLGLTAAAIPPAREVLPDGDLLLPVLLMLHANALTAGGNFAGAEAALAEAGPMLDALPGTPFVAAHREALEALGAARASAGPGSTAPPD